MRTQLPSGLPAALISLFVATGCAQPTVAIRHLMPAAVAVGQDVGRIEIGGFSIEGEPADGLAAFIAETLRRRSDEFQSTVIESPVRPENCCPLKIAGTIHVDASETRGTRTVRRRDGRAVGPRTDRLDSLVRKVEVRVDFTLTRPGRDGPPVTVETHKTYDSAGDPRLRGKFGLLRSDDPRRVPAKDEIIRGLLKECVETFWAMITPLPVSEDIALRPSLDAEAAAGLRAAGAGDLRGALKHFQAAAERNPKDVGALFNLAVAAEATGQLQLASKSYRKVERLTDGRDAEAVAGARRVRRLLAVKRRAGG